MNSTATQHAVKRVHYCTYQCAEGRCGKDIMIGEHIKMRGNDVVSEKGE